MATIKNATIRLEEDMVNYLTSDGESINQGIVSAVEALAILRRSADNELKGVFSPDEWCFLADSLNGSMALDSFRVAKDALQAHNEDAALYEGTDKKWNVDIKTINEKISRLSGCHIDAVYRRIEKYWNNCSNLNLIEWAKY